MLVGNLTDRNANYETFYATNFWGIFVDIDIFSQKYSDDLALFCKQPIDCTSASSMLQSIFCAMFSIRNESLHILMQYKSICSTMYLADIHIIYIYTYILIQPEDQSFGFRLTLTGPGFESQENGSGSHPYNKIVLGS